MCQFWHILFLFQYVFCSLITLFLFLIQYVFSSLITLYYGYFETFSIACSFLYLVLIDSFLQLDHFVAGIRMICFL